VTERQETQPDSVELAEEAAAWRSAYVHVPFCRRRCPYCDFAVVTSDEGGSPLAVATYTQALVAEVGMEPAWGDLHAANFGGGTPSSVPVSALGAVLRALRGRFGLRRDAEISIEVNPEDWDGEYAAEIAGVGFGRVSLGVQSFDGEVLRILGRLHDPTQAQEAFARARAAGIGSISLDLIYGTPGESLDSWRATVETALVLQPDHLSAYALTVERGTELSRAVAAGAPEPDPDDQADKYEHLLDAAAEAGLVRYEVSNFARPGHACRYNLGTWAQGEYLAFGLGAHGHRNGVRRRNVRRLDRYLEAVDRGERPEAGRETLDDWGRERERLMLGLRRAAGVTAGVGGAALLASEYGGRLAAAGVLVERAGRLVVLNSLLTDAAVRAVLALPQPE
jgi:oxygen-independent coproporphyrinogen-3 oxidase